jgi:hypothetical protein
MPFPFNPQTFKHQIVNSQTQPHYGLIYFFLQLSQKRLKPHYGFKIIQIQTVSLGYPKNPRNFNFQAAKAN